VIVPFLGDINVATGLIAIFAIAFGYIIGSGLKHSVKYIIVIFLLMGGLYFLGYIGADVLEKMSTLFKFLEPLLVGASGATSMFSAIVSLPIIAFLTGIGLGFWRS
jgi:hypothetical protein